MNTKTTTIKIKKINCTPEIDPYHRDTQQLTKTYLTIDPTDGLLWIDQECDDNSTPEPVWNGRMLMRRLSSGSILNDGEIRNYLQTDEAQELFRRICAGHDVEWNGNNMVGRVNADADAALDKLVEKLECYTTDKEAWTRESYLYQACTAEMTDDEIEQVAKDIKNDANIIILDGDPKEYMIKRRAELREE